PASEDSGLSLVASVAWGVNHSMLARLSTDPGGASWLADPPWRSAAAPAACPSSGLVPAWGTSSMSTSPAATPAMEKFAPIDNASLFDFAIGAANRNGFSTNRYDRYAGMKLTAATSSPFFPPSSPHNPVAATNNGQCHKYNEYDRPPTHTA